VGFDPHRKHTASRFDYFFVAAAFAVVIGLVIWALAG
jgi:hypothetical protein